MQVGPVPDASTNRASQPPESFFSLSRKMSSLSSCYRICPWGEMSSQSSSFLVTLTGSCLCKQDPLRLTRTGWSFGKGGVPVLSLGSPQPPLAGRGLQYCQKLGAMGPHTCHCSALGSLSPKLTSVHTEQGNYGMGSSKKQGYLGGRRWLSVLYLEAT